jgi:AcrR family transcriptional regulator
MPPPKRAGTQPGRQATPRLRREDRWEDLLSAAADVFYKKGYDAATVQDVASRAGILKGSIYYYIETKEDLLYALIERVYERVMVVMEEGESLAAAPGITRLAAFLERWMDHVARELNWMVIGEREFLGLRPDRLKTVLVRRDALEHYLQGLLQQAIDEGSLHPDTPVTVASNTIFSMMNHTADWYRKGTGLPLDEIGAWYCRFILRGLAVDSTVPDLSY